MTSAVPKASTDRNVVALICLASNMRSATEINATRAVAFNSSISRLPHGGSISRTACGKMIRHIRAIGGMLSASAASYCPLGTIGSGRGRPSPALMPATTGVEGSAVGACMTLLSAMPSLLATLTMLYPAPVASTTPYG